MANGCYAVVVLIPQKSDLTPERAVLHFSSHWFRRPNLGPGTAGDQPVRAEVLSIHDSHFAEGFRVWYGDWSISAWLESGPSVVADHQHLAAGSDLPATSDVVASCQARLSV